MTYHKGQIIEVTTGTRAGRRFPVRDVYRGDPEVQQRPGVSIFDDDTELFYGLDEVRAEPSGGDTR